MVANFVSDSLGRTAVDDSSRPLSNDIDKAALLSFRDRAELVLTTAVTAKAEGYRRLKHKALAIASRSGDFEGIPALAGEGLLILVTTRQARKKVSSTYAGKGVLIVALRKYSPRNIRRALKIRGFRRIVLEAGPTFTDWFAQGRALSELAVSFTGLAGDFKLSDATEFLAKLPAASFELTDAKNLAGTALTRWKVSSKTR